MESKKIIVYTETYLPSIGGLENNTLLLCESLVSLGFLVTLISPQQGAIKHQQFKVIESRSLKVFLAELKKHNLLIVNGGVSFKIIIPALISRKPYIIIFQMATLFNDIRDNNIKTKILNRTRKFLASLAKKNIGVSEYSFLQLQQIFGEKKAGLLINPADPEFYISKAKKDPLHIPFRCLFAGRLIEGKGIKLLIEAIKQINREKELIHLQVVGDGPEKKYVMNQVDTGFISYHPPVNKTELKNWLNSVDLTVIPSTHHIEGSPLIMAESLMMKVPVLVSSQPAMVASIQHQNLVFESGNLQDLINKLSLLTIPNAYKIVEKHCEKIAEQYSYANYLENLKSIIDV